MASANAWLLTLSHNFPVAVGEFELIHVIPDPPTPFAIPRTPRYCRHVIAWERKILPVMDLAHRLLGEVALTERSAVNVSTFVAVVAYYTEGTLRYGALLLDRVPARIRVDDDQACVLAEPLSGWGALALSCFTHQEYGPVPVLDLAAIFTSGATKSRLEGNG